MTTCPRGHPVPSGSAFCPECGAPTRLIVEIDADPVVPEPTTTPPGAPLTPPVDPTTPLQTPSSPAVAPTTPPIAPLKPLSAPSASAVAPSSPAQSGLAATPAPPAFAPTTDAGRPGFWRSTTGLVTAATLVVVVGLALFLAVQQTNDGGGSGGSSASGGASPSASEVESVDELFDAVGQTAGCTGDIETDDPTTDDFERGGCPTVDDGFLVFEVFESGEARDRLLERSGLDCSTVDDPEDATDDFGGVSVVAANWEISELTIDQAQALHDEFGAQFQRCD